MSQENDLARATVIMETRCGKVRGAQVGGVSIFRGIPYGGPTAGAGRFLPPSHPAGWSDIRDCTVTGPRCVQGPGNLFLDPVVGKYFAGGRSDRVELAQQPESENCLNLNVLTPGLTGKRPVLVYLHGGAFSAGSSALTLYSDRFVAEQDVVLVGVNHRLNVFGYLYLGELSEKYAAGNVGQLDLVAALEWVRDNIASFGGDPENVTIFGESGGGAKICTLMAMPAAQGLFHKAIVESGSMLKAGDRAEGTATARAVLEELGLDESRVAELEKFPAVDLRAALDRALRTSASLLGIAPVVDGRTLPHQTWDPGAPAESAGVPLMVGNCKDEMTLFADVFPHDEPDTAVFQLDEAGLRQRLVASNFPAGELDALLALYHRDHPGETPSDLFFRISTDRGARYHAVRQAELKVRQGGAPVYVYSFTWNTPCGDGRLRAFHTAELPLAMRLVAYPESEQLSREVSGAWAAFARTGNPSQGGLVWPAYSLEERATMVFDVPSSAVVNDPDGEERMMLKDRPSGSLL